jgi:hypothetical protein
MNKRLQLAVILALVFMPVLLSASDFNKGMEHMQNGDYARAYCLWEPLAHLGHPDAQYHVGWLYANGHGLNVDVETAVHWWQLAADNGYLDAQFSIGLAYITGEGIKANKDEAFRWFYSAAVGGHEDAKDIVKRLVLESGEDYFSKYPDLKKIDWLQQSLKIVADTVNVRSGPGTGHDIVYKAKKGEILTGISQKGDWYEVEFDSEGIKTGWIYAKLVSKL